MCPREAIRLSPLAIGGLGLLGDLGIGIREDEPDVQVRELLLNELHLLAVVRLEQPLGLNDDPIGQQQVGRVMGVPAGDLVG